jgi:hypothetical protein
LWGVTDDDLSGQLASRLPGHRPARRYLLAQLACRYATDPVVIVRVLLDTGDSPQRVAAARFLGRLDRGLPAVAALQEA